jgi:hypothetical protein
MKKTIISLSLILFSAISFGQEYCKAIQHIYAAEILYRSKTHTASAIQLYKKGFDSNIRDLSAILDAIHCATSIKDSFSTHYFITHALKSDLEVQTLQKLWPRIGGGMDLNYFLIKIDTKSIKTDIDLKMSKTWVDYISTLAERDQLYRGDDEANDNLRRAADSLNWSALKYICNKLGRLPTYTELGNEGSENLDILFIHMDKDILEYFLPFVIKNIQDNECYFGNYILYQLERIGLNDGINYTITEELQIIEHSKKTKINADIQCQTFGEWFNEKHPLDNKFYFTPIDPALSLDEVNRVRALFCLDPIQSKWLRTPWVLHLELEEFKEYFK